MNKSQSNVIPKWQSVSWNIWAHHLHYRNALPRTQICCRSRGGGVISPPPKFTNNRFQACENSCWQCFPLCFFPLKLKRIELQCVKVKRHGNSTKYVFVLFFSRSFLWNISANKPSWNVGSRCHEVSNNIWDVGLLLILWKDDYSVVDGQTWN